MMTPEQEQRRIELFNKLSAVIVEFVYHEDNGDEITYPLMRRLALAVGNYYLFLSDNGEY